MRIWRIRAVLFTGAIILCAEHLCRAADYYVNSNAGNDDNAGTTSTLPWKTFKNLQSRTFQPGDNIQFACGSSYIGGFEFNSSGTKDRPITFSSYGLTSDVVRANERAALGELFTKYGGGPAPSFSNRDWEVLSGNIFHVNGSYIDIDGLYFHDNTNPPDSDHKNKNVQKMGAVYLSLGSHDCIVRNCEFFHTPVGIKIKGTHNLIEYNYLHDATQPMARSWGPIAIMVVSPNNEIAWNRVCNYGSYGGPYGSDGGVVELDGVDDDFIGRDVYIHHNTSINNKGFIELAGGKIRRIRIADNLSDDQNQFLGGSSMSEITVQNNTIIRTREPNVDRFVFWTFSPQATSITVQNNIFVLASDIKVFGPVTVQIGHQRVPIGIQPHDHNLYYSAGSADPIGIEPGVGDVVANPLFIDAQHENFRLQAGSPAIDSGVSLGFANDLDGHVVPRGKVPDIGAFEF